MNSHATLPIDQLQPILRLFPRALRHIRAGLVAGFVLALACLAAGFLLPRKYMSEAVVYYREGLQWRPDESVSPRRVGQRLRDVISARTRLTKIVQELNLFPELQAKGRLAEAVEEARERTGFRFGESEVFIVSYMGRTPQEAQQVTARLTEVLIAENTRLRTEQAELAREFLDAEKKRKEAELAEKEGRQLRFLAQHPEFAQEPGAQPSALHLRPGAAPAVALAPGDGSALAALRREEARLRRLIASPSEIPPAAPPAELVAARNEVEARLREARRVLEERRATLTEQHPDVRSAAAAVAAEEKAFQRASEAIASGTGATSVAALRERLVQVQEEISHTRRSGAGPTTPRPGPDRSEAARRIVELETEFARLTREVSEARERLQLLDSQQFTATMTASLTSSGQTAQILVIDPASLPAAPVGASPKKLLAIGFLFSMFFAAGLMLVLGFIDDRIYDRADLEKLELGKVLAAIREPRKGRRRHAAKVTAETTVGPGGKAPAAPRGRELPPGAGALKREKGEKRLGAPTPVPSAEAPEALSPAARAGAIVPRHASLPETKDGRGATVVSLASQPAPTPPAPTRIQVLPFTGIVDERAYLMTRPEGETAASFRILRHRLGTHAGPRTLLVTSPHPGEEKTLTALNLALAFGEARRSRILLVEADRKARGLARWFGFQPPVGLGKQLELHRMSPEEPWFPSEVFPPSVHLLCFAEEGEPPLDVRALAEHLPQLREARYDLVLVEGPAILSGADVNVLEEFVDGILVAVRAREAHALDLRRAVEQIGPEKLLGHVLVGS